MKKKTVKITNISKRNIPQCTEKGKGWAEQIPVGDNTHRKILLNQPEIRFYLTCTDGFGTANGWCPVAVPNQSVHVKYNLIWV